MYHTAGRDFRGGEKRLLYLFTEVKGLWMGLGMGIIF